MGEECLEGIAVLRPDATGETSPVIELRGASRQGVVAGEEVSARPASFLGPVAVAEVAAETEPSGRLEVDP